MWTLQRSPAWLCSLGPAPFAAWPATTTTSPGSTPSTASTTTCESQFVFAIHLFWKKTKETRVLVLMRRRPVSCLLLQHLQQAALVPVQARCSASHRGGEEDLHLSEAGLKHEHTPITKTRTEPTKKNTLLVHKKSCSRRSKQHCRLGPNLNVQASEVISGIISELLVNKIHKLQLSLYSSVR